MLVEIILDRLSMGTKVKHNSSTAYSTEEELHCGLVPQLQRYTAANCHCSSGTAEERHCGTAALRHCGTAALLRTCFEVACEPARLAGWTAGRWPVCDVFDRPFCRFECDADVWRWRVTLNDANVEQAKKRRPGNQNFAKTSCRWWLT